MTTDFSQVMAERSDKQLAEIVTIKRDEYQIEAIKAAEKEIETRKIDVFSFYTIDQIEEIKNSAAINKSEMEFRLHHKILTILLPILIIICVSTIFKIIDQSQTLKVLGFPIILLTHYIIHNRLKETGYIKMAKDFLKWIAYTLYIYIGILLIGVLVIFIVLM